MKKTDPNTELAKGCSTLIIYGLAGWGASWLLRPYVHGLTWWQCAIAILIIVAIGRMIRGPKT